MISLNDSNVASRLLNVSMTPEAIPGKGLDFGGLKNVREGVAGDNFDVCIVEQDQAALSSLSAAQIFRRKGSW